MNEIPAFLKARIETQYGKETAEQIFTGYASARPVTLRVNTLKTDRERVKQALTESGIAWEEVSWYSDGLILPKACEAEIKKTALYERGEIYLQSLSSMLPPLYLGAKEGENILDMTAAPGSKTTQLSALTNGKAFLTACEKDQIRADRLAYNIQKQGAPRVSVLCEDACKLSEYFSFDRILLDAPCSGSGTIDLRYPLKISEKLIANCAALQQKLLVKGLSLLKKGGILLYSTCSILKEENEGTVQAVLSKTKAKLVPIVPLEGLPLLPCMEGTITVAPTALFEGFFLCALQKA